MSLYMSVHVSTFPATLAMLVTLVPSTTTTTVIHIGRQHAILALFFANGHKALAGHDNPAPIP